MQLGVTPALEDEEGQSTIEIRLNVAALQRPIPVTTGKVPGTDSVITIQTPIYATQELSFKATISAQEALLIGPLAPLEGTRPVMILVTADSVPAVAAPEVLSLDTNQ